MNDQVTPLVSVVIPSYNHGRYLGRTLQSVIDQTYKNWEVIVIDNHSTDNTDEIMANLASPRIKYLKINNKGVIAASRNMGIRAAKGELIAFLDSDDWWTNNKLEVCLSCINEKTDLIYHDMEIIDGKSWPIRKRLISSWQVKKPVLIDLLVKGNAIVNSSVVVRKNLLEKIGGITENTEMIAVEDYNTWLHIAKLTNQFVYLPHKLGYYLIHSQSVSKKDMSVPARCAVNEFLYMLTEKQKNKLEAKFKYTSGRYYYLKGEVVASRSNLWFSLRYGGLIIKLKSLIMLLRKSLSD